MTEIQVTFTIDGDCIKVASDSGTGCKANVTRSNFKEITNPNDRLIVAFAEHLGYDPGLLLNLD